MSFSELVQHTMRARLCFLSTPLRHEIVWVQQLACNRVSVKMHAVVCFDGEEPCCPTTPVKFH